MNPVTQDVRDVLVSAGIATAGTDLFIGFEPNTPDATVTLYDSGSTNAPDATIGLYYPLIQVRVRGTRRTGYQVAYARISSIRDLLIIRPAGLINATWYVGFWATSDVLFLSYDDQKRPIFTCNFRTQRSAT